jgi:hypothetical protein
MRLTDVLSWSMSLASVMNPSMPAEIKNLTFERGPGIAAMCYSIGARALCEIHIPAKEIARVQEGFERLKAEVQGEDKVQVVDDAVQGAVEQF